jgi:tetratricopeptide (TPR) repeat protein
MALGIQGKFKKSITVLEKAITIEPDNADLHANLGFSYSKIREWDEAIKHYRITLKIVPEHQRTQYNLKQALKMRQATN